MEQGKNLCRRISGCWRSLFSSISEGFQRVSEARAEEMVGGGRMFLLLTGRTSRDPNDQGFIAFGWETLESSLNDLASQVFKLYTTPVDYFLLVWG
jgi:hypothetical protein